GDEEGKPKTLPFAHVFDAVARPVQRFCKPLPLGFRRAARTAWLSVLRGFAEALHHFRGQAQDGSEAAPRMKAGANLIGYVFGELGMGEHVRMTATALDRRGVSFGVVNFTRGLGNRQTASFQSTSL